MKQVRGIAGVANIPEILAQKPLMEKILHKDYLETAGINEFAETAFYGQWQCCRGFH